MEGALPYLRFRSWHRVWWTLWIMGRWDEWEMHPPPDASFDDVIGWADRIRAAGVECEVIYP